MPQNWKRAKIVPIIKSVKEDTNEVTKFRRFSFLNVAGKVLEKILINRIMHHIYTNNTMNRCQFRFTPQTSKVDAVMSLKGNRTGDDHSI